MKHISKGFTIIELLIVIIVIAVLATISIVAYNGSQDRAEYAHAASDMKHINDALLVYKAQNGSYPSTGGAYVYQNSPNGGSTCGGSTLNTTFLSMLVPSYLDTMPVGKTKSSYTCFSYAYISNGTDYKLLRWSQANSSSPYTGLSQPESTNNSLIDPQRTTYAWGYWTQGAASW